ncbi:hypothetical protein [Komagataeibacter swingsii]|uniref:Uncharacterized protein n=1 Tax=Komagataeibacter swingsii TaxID=215220 RepID=A0A850NYD7_9PROT|nr:hypothetical protein [Komagataeibacter swingsii]NVN37357.1 hypothetical protein [Komagataeibacter swingsii]
MPWRAACAACGMAVMGAQPTPWGDPGCNPHAPHRGRACILVLVKPLA